MCRVAVGILLVCVSQTHANVSTNKLVDKLVNKLFDTSFNQPLRSADVPHTDLDSTTLRKPGHLAVPSRIGLNPRLAIRPLQAIPSNSALPMAGYLLARTMTGVPGRTGAKHPMAHAGQDQAGSNARSDIVEALNFPAVLQGMEEVAREKMDSPVQRQMQTEGFGLGWQGEYAKARSSSAVREGSKVVLGLATVLGAAAAQAAAEGEDANSPATILTSIQNSGNDVLTQLQKATSSFQGFSGAFENPIFREIGLSIANTVIAWGVPLGATVAVVALFSGPKGDKDSMSSMSSTGDQQPSMMSPFDFFNMNKKETVTEYLKIDRLNDQLESYSYSMTKAFRNKRQAVLEKQRAKFARAYGAEIASKLDEGKMKKLVDVDKNFHTKVSELRTESDRITRELRIEAAKSAGKKQNSSMMEKMFGGESGKALQKKQLELAKEYSMAEFKYIKAVSAELPKDTREEFAKLLKTSKIGLQQDESPFLSVEETSLSKPHVFCLKFNGDGAARQVESLRKEVTAIIRAANATRNDEVILRLTSPGGTVTGYGRASAQLIRIKDAGLKLTICVEEVAASGGYMMACVADHLVASPMAVLGSIGVIQELPNAYNRLTKEGLRFITVTAGEYKRTLTPFKKPTPEDEAKLKKDIGMVWSEFKSFVKEQRPSFDVEQYGTGETWFGNDALKRNLCDEIANSDDIILDKLDKGSEIYQVTYKEPKKGLAKLGLGAGTKLSGFPAVCNLLGRLLVGESLEEISGLSTASRKYMAIDQTAENTYFLDEQ